MPALLQFLQLHPFEQCGDANGNDDVVGEHTLGRNQPTQGLGAEDLRTAACVGDTDNLACPDNSQSQRDDFATASLENPCLRATRRNNCGKIELLLLGKRASRVPGFVTKLSDFVQESKDQVEAMVVVDVVEREDGVDLVSGQRQIISAKMLCQLDNRSLGQLQGDKEQTGEGLGVYVRGQAKRGGATGRCDGVERGK